MPALILMLEEEPSLNLQAEEFTFNDYLLFFTFYLLIGNLN